MIKAKQKKENFTGHIKEIKHAEEQKAQKQAISGVIVNKQKTAVLLKSSTREVLADTHYTSQVKL